MNYPAGLGLWSIAVGDFNGDGKTDVVVANFGAVNLPTNYVSVLLGNGDGTFQAAVNYGVGPNPTSVVVADFNGDGRADIATANSNFNANSQGNGNVSVLLGNGDGTFQQAMNYEAGSAPYSLSVGDFDGDGNADLVVTNIASNNLSVLLGNGDGTFRVALNYPVGSGPASVAIGDFNGDGTPIWQWRMKTIIMRAFYWGTAMVLLPLLRPFQPVRTQPP